MQRVRHVFPVLNWTNSFSLIPALNAKHASYNSTALLVCTCEQRDLFAEGNGGEWGGVARGKSPHWQENAFQLDRRKDEMWEDTDVLFRQCCKPCLSDCLYNPFMRRFWLAHDAAAPIIDTSSIPKLCLLKMTSKQHPGQTKSVKVWTMV